MQVWVKCKVKVWVNNPHFVFRNMFVRTQVCTIGYPLRIRFRDDCTEFTLSAPLYPKFSAALNLFLSYFPNKQILFKAENLIQPYESSFQVVFTILYFVGNPVGYLFPVINSERKVLTVKKYKAEGQKSQKIKVYVHGQGRIVLLLLYSRKRTELFLKNRQ